jgi:glycosyltransferase involved in cell wall biosynthesis
MVCIIVKILFIEPFFGGSHREFALGFQQYSRHDVTLATLPDRFWKWRMRGAGIYFARKIKNIAEFDLIFTTDMLDLTDFTALAGIKLPPVVMYFHENQLSYPLSEHHRSQGMQADLHPGFTNIVSAFAADRVLFNSQFHFNDFMDAAALMINRMPDFRPAWMLDEIRKKAFVLYPGCRFDEGSWHCQEKELDPPLIIWNHRWEYDKNPEAFFGALEVLKHRNIPFRLGILGGGQGRVPEIFMQAAQRFEDEILVFGHVESRERYFQWLGRGAIAVSCAVQENFGISIVEAVRCGCMPLLPCRLAYPEIIPQGFHPEALYRTKTQFVEKLCDMLVNYESYLVVQEKLSACMAEFSWENLIQQYDNILDSMVTD